MVAKMPDILASIGIKKALPFTKLLNNELNKIRGSGVLQNIMAIPEQSCQEDEKMKPITLQKMFFLFTVFFIGGIISIIIFILERAISSKRCGTLKNNDNKQSNINTESIPVNYEITVEQNQKRVKKQKRKISHLNHQVRHLQRSLMILKMKNRKLTTKNWSRLQREKHQLNSQLQQEPKLICRPSSI